MSCCVSEGNAIADCAPHAGDAPAAETTGTVVLACPACRSADHLYTVEVAEVLVKAHIVRGQPQPIYDDEVEPSILAETLEWMADGPMLCRNCDQFDLRRADLIPTPRPAKPALTSLAPETSTGGAP